MTGPSTTTTTPRVPLRAQPGPGQRIKEALILAVDLGTWSSTATLYCGDERLEEIVDPEALTKLRVRIGDLLRDSRLAPIAEPVLDELSKVVNRNPALRDIEVPAELSELAGWLAQPQGDDLAREVAIAVERTLGFPDRRDLRIALAPELHRLYDAMFALPALRTQYLWPMAINAAGGDDVSSMLSIPGRDVTGAVLLDDPTDAFLARGMVFPGIKRRLSRVEPVNALADRDLPAGWEPDTELLLGLAVRNLVQRVEVGALGTRRPAELKVVPPEPALGNFVFTYPTTLAPQARKRMRDFVVDALGCPQDEDVRMDWDEGVAAAMYFVVRGIAGYLEAGLDTFRHRARPVLGAHGTAWRQHMLVIDIGGGTTDIALLAVDLVDTTGTPLPAADEPETRGRTYVLRPRVLGTTGHPQLGGDLLSLRLFYCLKAAIADALYPHDERGPFVPQVVRSRSLEPVPRPVRQALRELVPTHLRDRSAIGNAQLLRGGAFDLLWSRVEKGKKHSGQGWPDGGEHRIRLSTNDAEQLPMDCEWRAALAGKASDIGVSDADFTALCRPIIEAAAGLGAELVRRCLAGDPEARLDVVALSGRTTTMSGVDQIMVEVLARELARPGGGGPVAWDPSGVVVETANAKQAASIGAAWAASAEDIHNTIQVASGRDELRVEVRELLATLPMDLGLAGRDGKPLPLLRAGTRFDMTDPTGRWSSEAFTRSGWQQLSPLVSVHRILSRPVRDRILATVWGVYRHDRDQANSGTLWYQVQIGQDLVPKLLLCRGTTAGPRPWLHPDEGSRYASAAVVDLRREPRLRGYFADDALSRVPRIAVRCADERDAQPVEVFPAGPADDVLTCRVSSDGGGHSPHFGTLPGGSVGPVGGLAWTAAVSAVPLPRPTDPATSGYRFLVDGVELDQEVAAPAFAPGEDPAPRSPHWAVLDSRGIVRIYAGYPAYLPAADAQQMWDQPGLVHLADMDEGSPMWDPEWDPFTGDH